MFPKLFNLPFVHYPVQSYGVLIAIGFVLCTQMIAREAKRLGYEPHKLTDLAFYLLLVGIAGSRLLFVIVNWRMYAREPMEIFSFHKGGLVFYGGFLAALAFAVWWSRRNKMPFFLLADILIPMVAFNHAWGRIGCLAVGCCFGSVTLSGLGIRFPSDSVVQATQHAHGLIGLTDFPYPVHATQLYEAAGELALFLLLVACRQRKRFHGQLLLLWLALYPILRSVIEVVRGDVERGFVVGRILSTSQFISIFVVLLAIILFRRAAGVAAAVLVLLVPLQLQAAERVTQKTSMKGPPGMQVPQPSQTVMLWGQGKLRTDNGSQQSTIFDFKADKMLALDHVKKQYTQMSIPELIAQMKVAMAQVKAQLEKLPPEQRAQMSSVLDPKPLNLQALDGDVQVGKFKAKKYSIKSDGKEVGEVYYTRDIDVTELAPFSKKMLETMKGMGSGWAEVLARTENGFPVKTVLTMNAMGQSVTYVTEIIAHDTPTITEALFKIPEGYTQEKK